MYTRNGQIPDESLPFVVCFVVSAGIVVVVIGSIVIHKYDQVKDWERGTCLMQNITVDPYYGRNSPHIEVYGNALVNSQQVKVLLYYPPEPHRLDPKGPDADAIKVWLAEAREKGSVSCLIDVNLNEINHNKRYNAQTSTPPIAGWVVGIVMVSVLLFIPLLILAIVLCVLLCRDYCVKFGKWYREHRPERTIIIRV